MQWRITVYVSNYCHDFLHYALAVTQLDFPRKAALCHEKALIDGRVLAVFTQLKDFSNSEDGLQNLFHKFNSGYQKCNWKMVEEKTKSIVLSKYTLQCRNQREFNKTSDDFQHFKSRINQ